jgi:hypothetical protein
MLDVWSDGVLAMMVTSSREEQKIGEEGWVKPPKSLRSACLSLVSQGLAKQRGAWFMPTSEGYAAIESSSSH